MRGLTVYSDISIQMNNLSEELLDFNDNEESVM